MNLLDIYREKSEPNGYLCETVFSSKTVDISVMRIPKNTSTGTLTSRGKVQMLYLAFGNGHIRVNNMAFKMTELPLIILKENDKWEIEGHSETLILAVSSKIAPQIPHPFHAQGFNTDSFVYFDRDKYSSNIIFDCEGIRVALFSIPYGKSLPPHSSPKTVVLYDIAGNGKFIASDKEIYAKPGALLVCDPESIHGIDAVEEMVVLTVII